MVKVIDIKKEREEKAKAFKEKFNKLEKITSSLFNKDGESMRIINLQHETTIHISSETEKENVYEGYIIHIYPHTNSASIINLKYFNRTLELLEKYEEATQEEWTLRLNDE